MPVDEDELQLELPLAAITLRRIASQLRLSVIAMIMMHGAVGRRYARAVSGNAALACGGPGHAGRPGRPGNRMLTSEIQAGLAMALA